VAHVADDFGALCGQRGDALDDRAEAANAHRCPRADGGQHSVHVERALQGNVLALLGSRLKHLVHGGIPVVPVLLQEPVDDGGLGVDVQGGEVGHFRGGAALKP